MINEKCVHVDAKVTGANPVHASNKFNYRCGSSVSQSVAISINLNIQFEISNGMKTTILLLPNKKLLWAGQMGNLAGPFLFYCERGMSLFWIFSVLGETTNH